MRLLSWDPRPIGIYHPQSLCLTFWRPENEILRGPCDSWLKNTWQLFVLLSAWKSDSCRVVKSYNPGQMASCQPLLDILANMKMRSFKGHDTHSWWINGFRWGTYRNFGCLNKRFLRVVTHSTPGQLVSCLPMLDILATWKWGSTTRQEWHFQGIQMSNMDHR